MPKKVNGKFYLVMYSLRFDVQNFNIKQEIQKYLLKFLKFTKNIFTYSYNI